MEKINANSFGTAPGFFSSLIAERASTLPSCLWSPRTYPSLPGSRVPNFYRDGSSSRLYHSPTKGWFLTCPHYTNSGCGKERRILFGPWWPAKAALVRNYLKVYPFQLTTRRNSSLTDLIRTPAICTYHVSIYYIHDSLQRNWRRWTGLSSGQYSPLQFLPPADPPAFIPLALTQIET